MELIIALEQRFRSTADGRYWTESLYPRSYWSRYLTVFDGVKIVARVREAQSVADGWKRVDGDGVSFHALPAYLGPWDFACKLGQVRAAANRAVADHSAILLRVPGLIATLVRSAMQKGRPYAVEVLGDPYDVFSPGAVSHAFRPFFRWWFARMLRKQCSEAACSLYVTEKTLQRRYPPRTHPGNLPGLSVGVSDVELPEDAFISADALIERAKSRADAGRSRRFRIIFVGALEVPYKALDVLIEALARCVETGLDAELAIIGSGRHASAYESFGRRLGVSSRLTFLGSLPAGEPVRQKLDASDLFVLPSRVEGMPRALIEAMARGVACIGTRVGGVPELLPDHAMVRPGDPSELAMKIREVAANPERRAELAAHNLAIARRYHEDHLQPRRIAFYRCLRDLTAAWRFRSERQESRQFPEPRD